LRLHDKRFKRLWFLWPAPQEALATATSSTTNMLAPPLKCGCLGGCEFFGANKKGATFFRPRKHRESSQVAIYQVNVAVSQNDKIK
jgi:hypothetical protein